jgi:hypothetical protein
MVHIRIYSGIVQQNNLEILRTLRFLLKHYYSNYSMYFTLNLPESRH